MVTVCTVLAPAQRSRVDAAGRGHFLAFHCDTVHDALCAARERRLEALIVSPDACDETAPAGLRGFVGEFPAIAPIALVCGTAPDAWARLLRLGASGVRRAVDCSAPTGWQRLRTLVGRPASSAAARIAARLVPALGGPDTEAAAFFALLARLAPALRDRAPLPCHLPPPPPRLASRASPAGLP